MSFSFSENFTNIAASGTYVQIPERPIKAKIVDIKAHPHSTEPGAAVAEFFFLVTEPGFAGATRRMRMRVVDGSEKGQKVKALWRAALESVGYTSAQLDTGAALTISAANFTNKDCYLFHTPRKQGVENSYDEVTFITPLSYTERSRSLAASEAAQANHTAVVNTPAAPMTVNTPVQTAAIPQPSATNANDLRASLLA